MHGSMMWPEPSVRNKLGKLASGDTATARRTSVTVLLERLDFASKLNLLLLLRWGAASLLRAVSVCLGGPDGAPGSHSGRSRPSTTLP